MYFSFFKTGITMHLVRTFKLLSCLKFLDVKEFLSKWTE